MTPHVFVSANNAQFVAFAAKIIVGLTVPRIAAMLSYVSPPKAFLFYFFGAFSNLFALANDVRWLPSARKYRTRSIDLKPSTYFTVIMAVAIAAAVLVTDLLLFQLSPKDQGFVLKPTTRPLKFSDQNYTLGNSVYQFPEVLGSNASASQVFSNKIYIPGDVGRYMNYPLSQRRYFTLDGPKGDIDLAGAVEGEPRCTVAHSVTPQNVVEAGLPIRIRCFVDNLRANNTNLIEETVNTLGFNGQTVASWYQTKEGANYLFVDVIQRVYDHFESYNGTSGAELLKQKIDGFNTEGYKMVNALTNGLSVNLDNATDEFSDPWFLIEHAAELARVNSLLLGVTTFLFEKTELTHKYGAYPMYTKKYIICGTYLQTGFLNNSGQGNFYSYSYDTRQYFLKGQKLRNTLYGLNTVEINNAPLSAQFSTDRTDEEVILATLDSTTPPIEVIPTEMLDIFPGIVVIGICGLFILFSLLYGLIVRLVGVRAMSFDVNLEAFHKALDNLNGLHAWYLPAKFELADNVVMTRGTNLMTNTFNVGLASKASGSDRNSISLVSVNSTSKRPFSGRQDDSTFYHPSTRDSTAYLNPDRESKAFLP